MEILNQLAVALGFATLAGLNLYLTVFITGLAIRSNWVELAPQYEQLGVLGSDAVLIAAGIFFALEFFSDKIPWVDSFWDAVHTLIRPIGGGLLAIQTLGAVSPAFDVVIGLLAGGTTLVAHGFKAGSRLAINASPEPFSNVAASLTEDAAVIGGLALMSWNPLVAAVVFIGFLGTVVYFSPKLFRRVRAFLWLLVHKLGAAFGKDENLELYSKLSADETVALTGGLDGRKPDVLWSARILTGKTKGFPAIVGQSFATLIAESGSRGTLHLVGSRLWRTFHEAIPLEDLEIVQESRLLSEDVVLYSPDGIRRLQLRLHAGNRSLAEKIVEGILNLRNGAERPPALETAPEEEAAAVQ